MSSPALAHLTAGQVSVVLGFARGTVSVLYWGRALPHVTDPAAFAAISDDGYPWGEADAPQRPGFWREGAWGFMGTPALVGHRSGADWSPRFVVEKWDQTGQRVNVRARDEQAGLAAEVEFALRDSGVLEVTQSITNEGAGTYSLDALTTWLPLPDRVAEVLDFTGRWVKERQPQRRPIGVGVWTREVREGRSGHDHTLAQIALTPGTGFRSGEAWAVSLAWSGNNRYSVERTAVGRSAIGAGELLNPGEVQLAAGATYRAPLLVAAYSGVGLDGLSAAYYGWLRARPEHPVNVRPRPLTLNVWEAVWFDHDLERLTALMDVAAEVGVERFVLDDGWFHLRRDDHAGLGDWWVDPAVWPEGLGELIRRVRERGMEFGLWFEPEMVNPDSDLFRAHPDWVLGVAGRMPPEQRFQQVLNIAHPEAWDYLFGAIDALLTEYDIAYIKWDHNRQLVEPGAGGVAAARVQAEAFYRLVRALKAAHPGLEIESCASGGGRIDLGAALCCDRFWTSDCNDALERQQIQRWTGLVMPPELLGTHIGPTASHSTGRVHSLSFRAVTALMGHAGIEWDISGVSAAERAALRAWADYYKEHRGLLHSGLPVRLDGVGGSGGVAVGAGGGSGGGLAGLGGGDTAAVYGVVAVDRSAALFVYVQLEAAGASKPNNFVLAGLDPDRDYLVRMDEPAGVAGTLQSPRPAWADGLVVSGAVLMELGLRPPRIFPENAFIIAVRAVDAP